MYESHNPFLFLIEISNMPDAGRILLISRRSVFGVGASDAMFSNIDIKITKQPAHLLVFGTHNIVKMCTRIIIVIMFTVVLIFCTHLYRPLRVPF